MNEYKTTDLGLATALVCLGFELKGLDTANKFKMAFIFPACSEKCNQVPECKEAEEIAEAYFNSTLMIPAMPYFTTMKNLKSRIHNSK